MTILEMRQRAAELAARASDEMSPDALRALETEHADLVRQIEVAETAAWGGLRSRFGAVLGSETMNRIGDLPAMERRAALIDAFAEREAAMPETRSHVQVGVEHGERPAVSRMIDAALCRINPEHAPARDAAPFVGLSFPELARRCLTLSGHSVVGLSDAQAVVRGMHSTSDFPALLSGLATKTLLDAYGEQPAALLPIAKRVSVPDFKPRSVLRLSAGPSLEHVSEHGEFTRGSFEESSETFRVKTFGRVFAITRQALINDDLNAFGEIPSRLAASCRALETEIGALYDARRRDARCRAPHRSSDTRARGARADPGRFQTVHAAWSCLDGTRGSGSRSRMVCEGRGLGGRAPRHRPGSAGAADPCGARCARSYPELSARAGSRAFRVAAKVEP